MTATSTRCVKFYAVGGLGILVQLAALEILTAGLHLHYALATALAVEAAIVHNYLWHERFTWADRPDPRSLSRFLKFNLTTGAISILANVAIMRMLLTLWNMNYLVANMVTITVCSVVNFLVSDHMVFQRGKQDFRRGRHSAVKPLNRPHSFQVVQETRNISRENLAGLPPSTCHTKNRGKRLGVVALRLLVSHAKPSRRGAEGEPPAPWKRASSQRRKGSLGR